MKLPRRRQFLQRAAALSATFCGSGNYGVRIDLLMFFIALTSCTTWAPPDPSPWRWRKEGGTVEQQRRDQAECATASDRAYNASTGDTTVRAAAASRVAEDGFRAKGYYSPAR
jgi:hypothetical protein